MDIINIRSSLTLLVCCVAAAGFFLDKSPRAAKDAAPRVVQAAPPPVSRVTPAVAAPAVIEDMAPVAEVPAPARQAPISAGVRLASTPQQGGSAEAAERALAEDLQAVLD